MLRGDAAGHRHDRQHRIDAARLRKDRRVGDEQVFVASNSPQRIDYGSISIGSHCGRSHLVRGEENLTIWRDPDVAQPLEKGFTKALRPLLASSLERPGMQRHHACGAGRECEVECPDEPGEQILAIVRRDAVANVGFIV